jgi:lipoate-protein ligase A
MHGEYKIPGGKLVVVDLEVRDAKLTRVQVSGDFFLNPDSALAAINAALENQPADAAEADLAAAVQHVLDDGVDSYGLTAEGVARCVRRALESAA